MKYKEILPANLLSAPSVTADSRFVEAGGVFVAIKGETFDGNLYIKEAIKNGAAFIISESDNEIENAQFIKVDNARDVLVFLSHTIYNQIPSNILAVTGTNGKTSIASITRDMLLGMKKQAASIGTLGVIGLSDEPLDTGINTPNIDRLSKYLYQLAQANIDYVIMEASSHGLDQNRVIGVPFKAAAFTNLTQDHLDYHHSFENYFKAKMLLFSKYMQNGVAVLNADIEQFHDICMVCAQHNNKVISYGADQSADLRLLSSSIMGNKQRIEFEYQKNRFDFRIPLFGVHQAYNVLASIGLLVALNFNIQDIVQATSSIAPIPGRMELVSDKNNKFIFIDYSHSTDSLQKALETLIALKRGKIWLVFGCGGDRDKEKRTQMGSVANALADYVIVTDDNPRTEEPSTIRAEILSNALNAIEIGDRKAAIKYAINAMAPGDSLLIAGKGHEKYQIIGDRSIPFDEHKIVQTFAANA
jgi:UDP-N-acetylmuramoyl-L-alanyl-D-glutamate--2,6-diaminopimelate ligase